jgi:RNA polymerase-binding transcription factor DksA
MLVEISWLAAAEPQVRRPRAGRAGHRFGRLRFEAMVSGYLCSANPSQMSQEAGGPMMKASVARRLLTEERDRLERIREGVYEGLGDPADERTAVAEVSGADQHPADAGTERFEREKDLSIIAKIDVEIADVQSALRRVDKGGYGVCELCRRPIGEARLRARPAARFCVKDQASLERQARSA